MKWLLLGVLLGLVVVYPSLLSVVVAIVAALVSQPVVVAFALGIAAGRNRRWAR